MSKDEALKILSTMPVDDPRRAEYVSVVGYDPNDKWRGPTGDFDTSMKLMQVLRERGAKPEL